MLGLHLKAGFFQQQLSLSDDNDEFILIQL